MSKWKFTNIRRLEKEFTEKVNDIKLASSEGLVEAGKYLLDLSQPLVPVDTGRLKDSGRVIQENKDTVYVTYEAFNPENGYEYAPIQHEVLDFHHDIGQAKYLEEPFATNINLLVEITAGKVKEGVNK